MDRHVDTLQDTTIAQDVLYMYARIYSSSQSRDIHVEVNLAKYPPGGLKCTPTENCFDYSNVRALHMCIKNITLICLKLIYKKVI